MSFARLQLLILLAPCLLGCRWDLFPSSSDSEERREVVGSVLENGQPVPQARVRWKGRSESTVTDDAGRFVLPYPADVNGPLKLTASKVGFFITGSEVPRERDPNVPLQLTLEPLPQVDHEAYAWIDPTPDEQSEHNCGNCHPTIYQEWQRDAHSRSATNPRFLNLYDGTNLQGEPNQGWGMLPEYPEAAGVCTACHAPAADLQNLAIGDIRDIEGVAKQGVHCDFCHKIQDVSAEAQGLTHGRFGIRLLRPQEGSLTFGPLDDVDVGTDTHLPLESESRFCAPCHEGVIFGVHAYSTYSEWLASPDRGLGKTCQSCHMRPTGKMTNMAPDAGGIERDPQTLATHTFMPDGLAKMLRDCLELTFEDRRSSEGIDFTVQIRTRSAGHRVPTGFIDRHLLLVVEGFDQHDIPQSATEGPRLPPPADDLAGQSGQLFAKILLDEDGRGPIPFWRPAAQMQDTRLGPEEVSRLQFRYPPSTTRWRVRLIHRRFWRAVTRQKNWPEDQITVHDCQWTVSDQDRGQKTAADQRR